MLLFLHQGKKRRIEVGIYPIERAYHTHLIVKRATFWCPHVGAYPNTPYRYPVRGKRKTCDDQICKMIFGPKGRLWGVYNTPLPENMKTQYVLVLLLGRRYKTRRVSVFHLRWKCKTCRVSVFHLRWKCKTRRVSVFHLRWKYRTHRIWMFPCRGLPKYAPQIPH